MHSLSRYRLSIPPYRIPYTTVHEAIFSEIKSSNIRFIVLKYSLYLIGWYIRTLIDNVASNKINTSAYSLRKIYTTVTFWYIVFALNFILRAAGYDTRLPPYLGVWCICQIPKYVRSKLCFIQKRYNRSTHHGPMSVL